MKIFASLLIVCLVSAESFGSGGGLFSRVLGLRSRSVQRVRVVQPIRRQVVRQRIVQPIVKQQVIQQQYVQPIVQQQVIRQKVRVQQQVVPMYSVQQYAVPVQSYSTELYQLNSTLNQLDCVQGY